MLFAFQAKNRAGELVQGNVEAPSEEQAVSVLQQRELIIISIEQMEGSLAKRDLLDFFRRPTKKDVVLFTRQLATLIDADVPLLDALNTLTRQIEKASFHKIISSVSTSVEGGATLSVAFAEHSHVFDDFYVNLVKVGEVSGKLQETLLYLADYLERSAEIASKVKGALFYPAFILVTLIVVSTIMVTSVIPQLLTLVVESGVTELPITTRLLLFITRIVNDYLFFFILIVAVVMVLLYYYFRSASGRYNWDSFKITVPQFGKIIRSFYLSRIAETLSTLIKSRVPILDALRITSNVVGNLVYKQILMESYESVRTGGAISATMSQYPEFIPTIVISMIQTGEKTGRTAYMLDNVVKFYKADSENSIRNLSSIIEPVLMVILGVGVAILVSAVLLPIYSMVGA